MSDNKLRILTELEKNYKGLGTALVYNSPYQLLVATILSAQSTDRRVNQVTSELFIEYGTPQKMALLTQTELEEKIKSIGLYQNKAKNILASTKILLEQFGGEVPQTREELVSLPGVGRKTANVVLANAFGIPAIAVDTHVFRVANRLGLVKAKTVEMAEQQLMELIPVEKWSDAHHWLIWHGRIICDAKKPKCNICFLKLLCKNPVLD